MFKKILIANRGEIACRIMRTARRMGIATVAVASEADRDALHVALADEAVEIGAGPATESYLRIDRIMAAARQTGAEAIHPGYGFLAENPDLPEACRAAGLVFVGPSADAMRALGGKAEAKTLAGKAGVPIVPGYQGEDQDGAVLAAAALKVGYPVMIKAVAGGGGRGMRLVEAPEDFEAARASAVREAASAFGDPRVLIEKRVVDPRHIEVQVFGDSHGNVVHMFERDCTLQRRNQKVIEEAPAPGMSPALREKMTAAAVSLAKSVGYEGAGTVEFLVEGGALTESAPWYFIEMNTRLQVEHPVTEEITGLDLVEWQLRVAAGEELPLDQSAITMSGHAVEARVCAEDPDQDFAPSIGALHALDFGNETAIRVETGVEAGSAISPFYDSLIAKLIARGDDRDEALDELSAGLGQTRILGVKTNLAFLFTLLGLEDVREAAMTTATIAERQAALAAPADLWPSAVNAGVKALLASERRACASDPDGDGNGGGPWSAWDGFQLSGPRRVRRPVLVDGQPHEVVVTWIDGVLEVQSGSSNAVASDAADLVYANGHPGWLSFPDEPVVETRDAATALIQHGLRHFEVSWPVYDAAALEAGDSSGAIRAPINGRIAALHVAVGDEVEENQPVAVVEAMKMEHVLTAPRAGVVALIGCAAGDQVNQGTVIAELEPEATEP